LSSTWDALKRAERERLAAPERAETQQIAHLDQLMQDVAAAQLSIHALEDRVEVELQAFQDGLRHSLAKNAEIAASRARADHEELRGEIAALADASRRLGRRWNAVASLIGLAVLARLLHC